MYAFSEFSHFLKQCAMLFARKPYRHADHHSTVISRPCAFSYTDNEEEAIAGNARLIIGCIFDYTRTARLLLWWSRLSNASTCPFYTDSLDQSGQMFLRSPKYHCRLACTASVQTACINILGAVLVVLQYCPVWPTWGLAMQRVYISHCHNSIDLLRWWR